MKTFLIKNFKWIVLGLAILAIGNYIGSCQSNTTIDNYKKQLQVIKQSAESTVAWADDYVKEAERQKNAVIADKDSTINKLQIQITQKNNIINRRKYNIDSLTHRTDSLLQILTSDTDCNYICQNAVALAQDYRVQIDSLNSQVTEIQSVADDYKRQRDLEHDKFVAMSNYADLIVGTKDSLQKELKKFIDLPPPKDPDRWFGIKLPSRTTMFFIGVAGGAIGSQAFDKLVLGK